MFEGHRQFKVKWLNYPDRTWEPRKNLQWGIVPDMIKEYMLSRRKKTLPQ